MTISLTKYDPSWRIYIGLYLVQVWLSNKQYFNIAVFEEKASEIHTLMCSCIAQIKERINFVCSRRSLDACAVSHLGALVTPEQFEQFRGSVLC